MQLVSKTASQLVSEAKQRIENLTPYQVAAELERGGVVLVDHHLWLAVLPERRDT